jgi:hypothetical protein
MPKDNLQAFIKYMSSLWGTLGGITAIFPLANLLYEIIPLPVDSYDKSTAPIAIPITSLVSVFTLFYSFVQRNKFHPTKAKQARTYFILGLVSLALFFLLNHFLYPLRVRLFPGLDSTDDYIFMLVCIVPFYVAFFSCATRAFAILALIEFKREAD